MKRFLVALSLPLFVLALGAAPDEKAEKKEEVKCPISGKPASAEFALNVNGEQVTFCCPKCPKAYLAKLHVAADKEKKCVLSGEAADPAQMLIHKKVELIQFCCGNCKAKWAEKNEIKFTEGTGKCPYSGEPGKEETAIVVNGEKVVFCCEKCQAKYKKENLAHLEVVAEGKCPLSGKKADPTTAQIFVTAKEVNFCCAKCQAKYIKANFTDKEEDAEKEKEKEKAESKEKPEAEKPTVRTS